MLHMIFVPSERFGSCLLKCIILLHADRIAILNSAEPANPNKRCSERKPLENELPQCQVRLSRLINDFECPQCQGNDTCYKQTHPNPFCYFEFTRTRTKSRCQACTCPFREKVID